MRRAFGLIAAIAAFLASVPTAEPAFYLVPAPGTAEVGPWVRASLAFVVTVCLDDVEYSIACRERGRLEVAQRLEQILIDDYTTGKAAGSLKVVFWVPVDSQAQLRFLREAEERASAAAAARLLSEHPSKLEQLRAWREAADQEARSGRNWQHDWAGRSHEYQAGPSRYQLIHIGGG